MEEVSIDIGYSSCKVSYGDKIAKFPTAISYAIDVGIAYGNSSVYEFEGKSYYVGKEAVSGEAFVTNDYKFLEKFAPLLIFHIFNNLKILDENKTMMLKTGLAIVDWSKKEDFTERIKKITVNGKTIKTEPKLIPQGAGCAADWVYYNNDSKYPEKLSVVDIGYNTINVLGFYNGNPVKDEIKSYPGHGVSSIIKPFNKYMENKFKMPLSEQESIKIFIKGEFKYEGLLIEDVTDKIKELKEQFVTKLFNTILVNDKKQLSFADVSLIAGGGVYLLQEVAFPQNYKFINEPYEFGNVRGYGIS